MDNWCVIYKQIHYRYFYLFWFISSVRCWKIWNRNECILIYCFNGISVTSFRFELRIKMYEATVNVEAHTQLHLYKKSSCHTRVWTQPFVLFVLEWTEFFCIWAVNKSFVKWNFIVSDDNGSWNSTKKWCDRILVLSFIH